jgi:hypothetical protein
MPGSRALLQPRLTNLLQPACLCFLLSTSYSHWPAALLAALPHFFLVLCFLLHAGERRCATLLLFFGAHPHVQSACGSENTPRDCGHLRSGR